MKIQTALYQENVQKNTNYLQKLKRASTEMQTKVNSLLSQEKLDEMQLGCFELEVRTTTYQYLLPPFLLLTCA